ncbi:MAG: zinc ribbon domain-containing protein [Candidatus Methanomethylophilus sp.]|nr:zinc ribbon domain-containing protein [Methanomethylophilus sp.]MDD4668879.1 zinc ribbon domain-containing protein [Methanomethylophilus sp.]
MKSKAITINDQGILAPENGLVCSVCHDVSPAGSQYCAHCGAALPAVQQPQTLLVPHRLTARDYVALAFGLIPGPVNVFGLGHLVMKKWSRGLMYLTISAVILYVRWFTPGISEKAILIVELLGFAIYLVQSLELLGLVMRPDVQEKDKGRDQ